LADAPADWSKIPTKSVTLFYPGESTYQWLRTLAHKKGNKQVKRGKACIACHQGIAHELPEIWEERVRATHFERDKIAAAN